MDRFDHIVVLMFESQSFDRILGWVPEADGRQGSEPWWDDIADVLRTGLVGSPIPGVHD